jgi:effector-binding domain-containing protein
MDYEVTEVPPASYAVIRRTVAFEELPQVMPGLLEETHAWGEANGGHGHRVAISSMTADGRLNIAPGVEYDGTAEPPEPIELVRTPAQRAAVYVHVGSYEELPGVYQRFWDALQTDGHTAAGEPREIYESHDGPDGPVTRIIWPIA